MADRNLVLRVLFSGLDRLTGPMKKIGGGAEAAGKDVGALRKEIASLKKAQADLSRFKALEASYRSLRVEMDATEKPSAKLRARFEATGTELQAMSRKMQAAGVDIEALGAHEDRLALRLYDSNKALKERAAEMRRQAQWRDRGEKLKGVGGALSGAGGTMTLGLSAPLTALGAKAVADARESAAAMAQVEAVLKSMGPVAGRTAEQLQAQASALQDLSLFDDDDVLRTVTANMLTFGNIAGKSFDRAQLAAVNLSARLKQDLQSSTIQIGKALNDPVKGVTALQRVGVTFTATQKEMIKNWAQHGQIAKAQGLILGELEKEFGGAAAAARAADPAGAAKQEGRQASENLGGAIEQALPPATRAVTDLLHAFNQLSPATQKWVVIGMGAAIVAGPLLTGLGGVISAIGILTPLLGAITLGGLATAGIFLAIGAAVGAAAYLIYSNWGAIAGFFKGLWASITGTMQGAWAKVSGFFGGIWSAISGAVREHWTAIRNILLGAFVIFFPVIAAVVLLAKKIYDNWGAIRQATVTMFSAIGAVASWLGGHIGAAWVLIKGAIGGVVAWVGGIVAPFMRPFLAIAQFMGGLVGKFAGYGWNIVKGLAKGIWDAGKWAVKAVLGVAGQVGAAFAKALGIRSPSRVFMGLGGYLTQGLAIGIEGGAPQPIARMKRLGDSLTGALAAGAAMMSGGATPASAAPGSGASAPAGTHYHHYEFHIRGEGLSAQEIADAIERKLEELKKNEAAAARSAYRDDD
jgi:hypothetical protein